MVEITIAETTVNASNPSEDPKTVAEYFMFIFLLSCLLYVSVIFTNTAA